ncbi:efflux RND transporter permease subunit [bacterium]|nr:efflux RND transporter permease subunit [bacterium]
MRRIINLFIDRPVFASMIILALVVIGGAALKGLGVDRLPKIDMPTVSVRTSLPGASIEEVEMECAEPIEEVINTVDGIDELRSTTRAGTTGIATTFKLERDIETAAQDIRDKVSQVTHHLPDDATPPSISKFDSDSQPAMTLALYGQRTKRELTEIGERLVKIQLERSSGVGEVEVVGGATRTVNIDINADRLVALGIPITTVRDAIARQNREVPGGLVTGAKNEMSLRTLGRMTTAAEFATMVIANSGPSQIRLSDVARVEDGIAEERSVGRLNVRRDDKSVEMSVPTVQVNIRRQSGANVVNVIEAVKENLARVREQLPPGVTLEIVRDQSRYIYQAMHEIETHLIVGSILACLVVLVFTRSWRSTIITGIAIPVSVISTFGMMWLLDFTLNSVTMLALVLMIGIVIDDAIVVLENIFRFIEEKKMPPIEAARKGAGEIAFAVLATTLSLAVIFVPVSFMSSISGRFLFQFGITAAVAVMVSLVISIVLTPTLSGRMLGGEASRAAQSHHGHGSRGGFYHYLDASYTAMLAFVLRHRFMTSAIAVGVMLSSIPLFKTVQLGYLPQGVDEAEFEVNVEGPQSASVKALDGVMRELEQIAMGMPEVRMVLDSIGANRGMGQGYMYIRIAPHSERYWSFRRIWQGLLKGDPLAAFRGNYTQTDVMNRFRGLTRPFRDRGVAVRIDNIQSFNIGGGNFPIDISISGPDLNQLAAYSANLAARAEKIGGLNNVQTTLRLDKPELNISIDRDRAAALGINSNDIGTALSLMVGGDQEVSRFRDPATNEYYDVRLRLAEPYRNAASKVPELLLAGGDGKIIELSNLAKVKLTNTPSRIDRVDRRRDSRVRASVAPGFSLAERIDALMEQVRDMNLQPGYYVSVRGQGREFARTYNEFVFAFVLSIIFMYMILASQFENLIHPVTILLSLPLAVPFALLSLWLSGEQLNLYSALGILVLFGVVKKNAILQIDHMNQLRAGGMERHDAMMQGCRDRLRPILMTTLCLVMSMLPLWLGTGPGAEERRAVAVVVIGGQTLSLLLTLLVTPVAYSLLDDIGLAILKKRAPQPVAEQSAAK